MDRVILYYSINVNDGKLTSIFNIYIVVVVWIKKNYQRLITLVTGKSIYARVCLFLLHFQCGATSIVSITFYYKIILIFFLSFLLYSSSKVPLILIILRLIWISYFRFYFKKIFLPVWFEQSKWANSRKEWNMVNFFIFSVHTINVFSRISFFVFIQSEVR